MGNVIGVDCSYASKQLLDKLFVTITFENKDSGKVIDALIAKHTFFNGCETGNSPVLNGDRTFRLLTVAARDVDSAAHILSQYRQTIKRIVFCGNPPITLLSTLESLLPNAVISECDYETCLHLGKSMAISSKGAIFAVDDEGGLFESNEPLQNNKGHLHAAVHSNALYALYSPNKGEPRYVGHSVIGYSAIAAIFNMFLKRFDSMDPCRVFIPKIGEIASGGNSATCDMLVKNIYGGGCEAIGLPGDMLASSFGMLQKRTELWLENSSTSKNVQIPKHSVNNDDTQDQTLSNGTVKNESVPICDTLASTEHLSKRACTSAKGGENISPSENLKDFPCKEDVAHSLLKVLTINVTQNASLHAHLNGVDSILFSGPLFDQSWFRQLVKQYVNRWSNRSFTMLICKNSMFLASLGAVECPIDTVN